MRSTRAKQQQELEVRSEDCRVVKQGLDSEIEFFKAGGKVFGWGPSPILAARCK